MGTKAVPKGNGAKSFWEALFPGTTQKVPFTATSSQSAAVGSATTLVRVVGTAACHLEIGANPTATNSTSYYLPANVPQVLGIAGGQKIAVIRNSGDGDLFITEAT